jgi:fructuronate reductase
MAFVRTQARAGAAIVDPLADRLTAIGLACGGDPAADVDRFLQLETVFSRAVPAALAAAYASPL